MTKKQGMSCRCSRCRVCVTDVVSVSRMCRCHKCRVSVADVSLSQMWCQCHRCVRVTNMSLLLMSISQMSRRFHIGRVGVTDVQSISQMLCWCHRCPVGVTDVVTVSHVMSCRCHRCRVNVSHRCVRVTDVVSVSHVSVSPMSCRCHRCRVDSTDVVSVSQTCRCYKCGVDFTDVVSVSQMSCPCHKCRVRITDVVFVILLFFQRQRRLRQGLRLEEGDREQRMMANQHAFFRKDVEEVSQAKRKSDSLSGRNTAVDVGAPSHNPVDMQIKPQGPGVENGGSERDHVGTSFADTDIVARLHISVECHRKIKTDCQWWWWSLWRNRTSCEGQVVVGSGVGFFVACQVNEWQQSVHME